MNGSKNIVSENSFVRGDIILAGDCNIINNNWVISSIGEMVINGSFNVLVKNTVEKSVSDGIALQRGVFNVFYGNVITETNGYGLLFCRGSVFELGEGKIENNLFFQNIFNLNAYNFNVTKWAIVGSNFFDDGKVGNYWDDYLVRYPTATEVDHSGIGTIPYLVYNESKDNYPLLNMPDVSDLIPALPEPWSSLLYIPTSFSTKVQEPNPPTQTATIVGIATAAVIITVISLLLYRRRHRKIANAVKPNSSI